MSRGLDGRECRDGAAEVKRGGQTCEFGRLAGLPARCYGRATMADTTTIRLPPELRARLARIAKDKDCSVHSLIVEAVEKHADYEEKLRALAKRDRSNEVYAADDIHAWAQRIAHGEAAPFPAPMRK
jgi:predicted transcriptional regulator